MPRLFGRLLVFGLASAVVTGQVEAAPGGPLEAARDGPVTFARDVAPIIFDHCGICHHPNGSAPFSLLTFPAARQRATLIAAVTKSRSKPRRSSKERRKRELEGRFGRVFLIQLE